MTIIHHGHLVVKQWEEGPSQRVGGGGADRQVGDVGLHCTQYKTARLNIVIFKIMMIGGRKMDMDVKKWNYK